MNLVDLFNYLDSENRWKSDFNMLHFDAVEHASRCSTRSAKSTENRDKNRYIDVLPFDETRVILNGPQDYINASHVKPPFVNQEYICSQGPLMHTSKDFWKMVWDEDSSVIVMLNRIIESNRLKCHPYFPSGEEDDEGDVDDIIEMQDFDITLLSKNDYNFYAISELKLVNKIMSESRTIYHLHYYDWPDFGVPKSPTKFLDFLYKLRTYYGLSIGPPIIHCSAGIGRTGTLVLVDTILKIIEERQTLNIDIYSILIYTRQHRLGLVQTPDQLRFCFIAILQGATEFDHEAFNNERIVIEMPVEPESSEGSIEYIDTDESDMETDEEDEDSEEEDEIEEESEEEINLDAEFNNISNYQLSDDDGGIVSPSSIELLPEELMNGVEKDSDELDSISPVSNAMFELQDDGMIIKEDLNIVEDLEEAIPDVRKPEEPLERPPTPLDLASDCQKRKIKTASIVSDMKDRLKAHDKSVEQKRFVWSNYGKPLLFGSVAAVALSILVYLVR